MNLLPLMPILPINLQNLPLRKRRRDPNRIDPLDFYSEMEFRKRYRFSKHGFKFLCDELEEDLGRGTKRSNSLSTADQLCIALRFYACGSFLEVVGDTLFAVSKGTVSKIIRDVSDALARRLDKFIKFPDLDQELKSIKKGFYAIARFPGVVGAVNGTQIKIQAPSGDQEPYYVNRKCVHAIKVQAICDHKLRFLNIVADWPGSVHDARILSDSRIGCGIWK